MISVYTTLQGTLQRSSTLASVMTGHCQQWKQGQLEEQLCGKTWMDNTMTVKKYLRTQTA